MLYTRYLNTTIKESIYPNAPEMYTKKMFLSPWLISNKGQADCWRSSPHLPNHLHEKSTFTGAAEEIASKVLQFLHPALEPPT